MMNYLKKSIKVFLDSFTGIDQKVRVKELVLWGAVLGGKSSDHKVPKLSMKTQREFLKWAK